MKIGIPRSINYYQNRFMWKYFFEYLKVETIISPKTNRKIMEQGVELANDEMCLSLKNYLGHVAYLKDKCDYILVPRVDNYGRDNQTCTNFLSFYDLVSNLISNKILNYNIDYVNRKTEYKGYLKIGKILGFNKSKIKKAYEYAKIKNNKELKKIYIDSINKLRSNKTKVLVVGHDYNTMDELIGTSIIKYLEKNNCEVILSTDLKASETNKLSYKISKNLYWKYNKENIGAIEYTINNIDGIILLSSFPCGPDSIVNELVIRKIRKPIINLIIDDLDSFTGLETRLESFLDIVKQGV